MVKDKDIIFNKDKDKDQVLKVFNRHFKTSTGSRVEVNDDLSIDVVGNVRMTKLSSDHMIPVKFNNVTGEFAATGMELRSLKNSPNTCDTFLVAKNELTSLEGAPTYASAVYVSHNQLKDFKHMSYHVAEIYAVYNPLISLEGLPDNDRDWEIHLTYDPNLPMLRLLNSSLINVYTSSNDVEQPLNNIMDKYAGKGKSAMLNCALEMKKAGYVGNAKW